MEIIYGLGQTFLYSLIFFYPAWRILGRAGFSPWLALIIFVPMVGMVVLIVLLAFGRWPVTGDGGGRA